MRAAPHSGQTGEKPLAGNPHSAQVWLAIVMFAVDQRWDDEGRRVERTFTAIPSGNAWAAKGRRVPRVPKPLIVMEMRIPSRAAAPDHGWGQAVPPGHSGDRSEAPIAGATSPLGAADVTGMRRRASRLRISIPIQNFRRLEPRNAGGMAECT